jgi:CTP-dependent riboflavin kinase
MITITKKENRVLNQIKYFQAEYRDGVPSNILKLDLSMSETEFKDILTNLEDKGLISKNDNYIKANAVDAQINAVESRAEVLREDLNQTEKKTFELITNLASEGFVSRHFLEGNLLYGDLKLSNLQMYQIIVSLENKGLIKKIQKKDGEYYNVNT